MYRFLLSWRWAIITLIGLLLIPTMIRLGFWQYHRHEARVARNQLIAQNLTSTPVAFDSLTASGRAVPGDLTWKAVTATGQYDAAHEFVIRSRTEPGGSSIGYYVITPLRLADGKGDVLVNRGWVDSPTDTASYPPVPAPPGGQVTVTGRLRGDETYANSGIRDRGGLPDRQYKLINSEQAAQRTGATFLGGYLELALPGQAAGAFPEALPDPEHSDIGPHMAYAVQWWLFTALVPIGLVVFARREARDLAAAKKQPAPELVPA
ncbi:SURF1 family protein [Kitasatospora kazusensis]|uniref:SURF1-like protein n=1 Tax=Kitasatospora kazusensis TaxID=407974 RepID=A0ABN3A259_9ACTN